MLDIGFVAMQTTGSQKVYQYAPSATLIVLPSYEQNMKLKKFMQN